MSENILNKIEQLIKDKKINEAQYEISKLGPEYYKNIEYSFITSRVSIFPFFISSASF